MAAIRFTGGRRCIIAGNLPLARERPREHGGSGAREDIRAPIMRNGFTENIPATCTAHWMHAMAGKISWIICGVALVLAGGSWWFLSRNRTLTSSVDATPIPPPNIEWHLNHVRLHGVSGGKIVWEVDANDISVSKDRPLLVVHGVKRVALLNDGKQDLTLSADTLERNTGTGDISVAGHIHIDGNGLAIQTASALWDSRQETLIFPQPLVTQLGEYQLHCQGITRFNLPTSVLTSSGGLLLTLRGNTLKAGGIEVSKDAYTLLNPVSAELAVDDLTAWSQGQPLPTIPDISAGIRQRYRQYSAKPHGASPPNPVPRKGVQP